MLQQVVLQEPVRTFAPQPGAPTTATAAVRRKRRWLLALAVLALLLAASAQPVWSRVQAARVLLATLDAKSVPGALALDLDGVRVQPETIALAGGRGTLRSLRYRSAAAGDRPLPLLLVLHGVHPLGIDEPRQQRLARAFAAAGLEVHTPELAQLISLDVDARVIQQISSCAEALRAQHAGRKLGAFGISFTGGLLLMAAATPAGARSFAFVVAVGAHHDLRRVALHFAGETARGPNGERARAATDPYGARVLIAAYAPAFFAPPDVGPARDALRAYLAERYPAARSAAARLSPEGAQQLAAVLERGGRGAAPLLRELARARAPSLAALSPAGHLRDLQVPALVLHGLSDPIVPSTESAWLAREVPRGRLERLLITPALRHAEASATPTLGEQLALVGFVAQILADSR